MTTEFVHVVSTRLGIGIYDADWFDYRLTLFENITVPSMAAQTSQAFKWVIVVDKAMPQASRDRLNNSISGVPTAVILEVGMKNEFRGAVRAWSREFATVSGAGRVLSSRIDDDDAIHRQTFEAIHERAHASSRSQGTEYAVFAPTLGCMWLASERRGYTRYHDSIGIGLSVLEPTSKSQTVYRWPHRDIKPQLAPRGAYICHLDGETRWWLYTATSISDSEVGDGRRRDKIMNHRYGYYVGDELLESFGLSSTNAESLRAVPEPVPAAPTKFLSLRTNDLEREIGDVREKVAAAGRLERIQLQRRLVRLEAQRRQLGEGIIAGRATSKDR